MRVWMGRRACACVFEGGKGGVECACVHACKCVGEGDVLAIPFSIFPWKINSEVGVIYITGVFLRGFRLIAKQT